VAGSLASLPGLVLVSIELRRAMDSPLHHPARGAAAVIGGQLQIPRKTMSTPRRQNKLSPTKRSMKEMAGA